jgi:hypothetical protein
MTVLSGAMVETNTAAGHVAPSGRSAAAPGERAPGPEAAARWDGEDGAGHMPEVLVHGVVAGEAGPDRDEGGTRR